MTKLNVLRVLSMIALVAINLMLIVERMDMLSRIESLRKVNVGLMDGSKKLEAADAQLKAADERLKVGVRELEHACFGEKEFVHQ